MTDRPIIFSAPMVLALLAGRKTQTRRLAWRDCRPKESGVREQLPTVWQKAKPGDRLWVRENFRLRADQDDKPPSEDWWKSGAWYAADGSEPTGCGGGPGKLRPSIHMPRWASRLTLVVTDARVELVKDISEGDAKAEGCGTGTPCWRHPHDTDHHCQQFYAMEFKNLWNSINGPDAWDANPEVVALSFTVHKINIDKMEKAE